MGRHLQGEQAADGGQRLQDDGRGLKHNSVPSALPHANGKDQFLYGADSNSYTRAPLLEGFTNVPKRLQPTLIYLLPGEPKV